MANTTAGSLWNLPNLAGALFTPSLVQTPFLDRISMSGDVQTPEFAMSSSYDMEAASQPAITETTSLTAPTAVSYVRSNEKNVAQIFQSQVSLSYANMSANARMQRVEVSTSGLAYDEAGNNPVANEEAFQIQKHFDQMKMDMEYTFLNGSYQLATSAAVAFKTRGIITGSTTNTVAASNADIDRDIMDELFKEMANNGAFSQGGSHTIMCNVHNKVKLSRIYEYVPPSRTEGGSNIGSIMTDFGIFDIVYVPNVPAATILVANMSKCGIVFQPVANKPAGENRVILEDLAKTGAANSKQLYTQAGIDYGSSYFHGTITGTSTS